MFPRLDPVAPPEMVAETARLCASARYYSDSLYGRLLRENALDAVGISFPLFCRHVGEPALEPLIDAFIADHHATRPQFHHIATEFVVFAQALATLAFPLACLLEYEWVQLAAEVDPAPVPISDAQADPLARPVALNPTAHILLLPFDATCLDEASALGDGEERLPHAVYRTADHAIVTRLLTRLDCMLIDAIRDADRIQPLELMIVAAPRFGAPLVHDWIARELESGLLHQTHQI